MRDVEAEPAAGDEAEESITDRVLKIAKLAPSKREAAAEAVLRRPGVPGPAAEHAIQHMVAIWAACEPDDDTATDAAVRTAQSRALVIAKGADDFYAKQYRQYLNTTMGAFAATATHALIGAGTPPQAVDANREVRAAMVTGRPGIPPILVLDHQSVAVAVPIPRTLSAGDDGALWRWLTQQGAMPASIRAFIEGRTIQAQHRGTHAIERPNLASVLEVIEAALDTHRLALLALHPTDPDAMGLHITLFGVIGVDASTLASEHGLAPDVLTPLIDAAHAEDCDIFFLAGGTEEIFTQCSQNLFVKRPPRDGDTPPAPAGWTASDPLTKLLATQFELLQVTVSSAGLPGASPRNGDTGSAAYVVAQGNRDLLLIPYHPGNFIHGHAAKLWTNPYGVIVVRDEHHHLRQVIIRGPCHILPPRAAQTEFPNVVMQEISRTRFASKNRQPAYWFVQTVSEIIVESDPIAQMILHESRQACTISAAGRGQFSKKPAYFDAASAAPYDQALQHRREAAGRPTDASGAEHRRWVSEAASAMATRVTHLQRIARG